MSAAVRPLVPGVPTDWDWVLPLAADIFARAGEAQALDDLRTQSHLLVGDGEFVAFRLDSSRGERCLWVWAAHGKQGTRDFVLRHRGQLAAIARDCGACAIRFASARQGFMRSLGHEWRVTSIVYEWRIE